MALTLIYIRSRVHTVGCRHLGISHMRVFEVMVARVNMYRHGTARTDPLTARRWRCTLISLVSPACVYVMNYIKSLPQRRCHVAAAALRLVPVRAGGKKRHHYLHSEECFIPHQDQQTSGTAELENPARCKTTCNTPGGKLRLITGGGGEVLDQAMTIAVL